MNLSTHDNRAAAPFLKRLRMIYADMDREYENTADYYGFNCSECKDMCCRTRFHHHTYVENLFMLEGLRTLSPEKRSEAASRASAVCRESAELNAKGKSVRLMCPLNVDRRCILYPFRPMICRLHGIPHEVKKSADARVFGPGCEDFDRRCSEKDYVPFDRAPFYREMAALEIEFRRAAGTASPIKLTVAEMIAGIGHFDFTCFNF
jgi:hypothetical protein